MSANMNAPQVVSINTPRNDSVTRVLTPTSTEVKGSNSPVRETKASSTAVAVDSKIPLPGNEQVVTETVIKEQNIKEEDISQAVVDLNDYVQNTQRRLNFSVNEETGHTVIKVIDTETQETIRQIPSEEIVALAEQMRKNTGTKGHLFETEV